MKGFESSIERIKLMEIEILNLKIEILKAEIQNLKADIYQIKREIESKNGIVVIPTPKLEKLKII